MARATTTRTFRDRLAEAVRANDSLLCVGLDPVPARFPAHLRDDPDVARAITGFNAGVIAATADLVCAYKPNLGFYLAHGSAGVAALEATRRLIPAEIPAILDAKVGDVGSTAEAYATAYFDTWDFDAVTVNPYLGEDALAPFLSRTDRGVIVLAKTSNPGSGDLQDLPLATSPDHEPVYLAVAGRAAAWSTRWPATLGLVVGATYPEELAQIRRRCPDLPILLPGIGAQGGELEPSVRAGLDADGAGLLVSASRAIIYASTDTQDDWTHPVHTAALTLRDAINAARTTSV